MSSQPIPTAVKVALEYGPLIGFIADYLILRDATVVVAGAEYSGFVIVTAAFAVTTLVSVALLWSLTGSVSRIQIIVAVVAVLFGGLSVWMNDARLFKMKPTVIYGALALFLLIGLWRKKLWVKYIVQDMLPMEHDGWLLLTKRMTVLFILSAAANEVVWRTQSEGVWVIFETVVMPVIVIGFFIAQIGLFVEYATIEPTKKKRR